MAELTPKEHLQPSLLDRLADDEPHKQLESREQRVLSIERLHECIVRDLSWLLNADNFMSVNDLSDCPEVASSTVNYGIPTLSGSVIGQIDLPRLEDSIRESILRFEPRLLPHTVEVRAHLDDSAKHANSLRFDIEASAWAQPLPIQLLVTAEVDLETGNFSVVER